MNNMCQADGCTNEVKSNIYRFCSRSCSSRSVYRGKKWTEDRKKKASQKMRGSNNPNFGKKWTDDMKERQSEIISSAMESDEIRWKVGSANRGVKFSPERISKMHSNRAPESYGCKNFTSDIRLRIGAKSSQKFTPEYRDRMRLKYEELGIWTPRSEKSDWQVYQNESNWNCRLFDLFQCFDIFHPQNNVGGLVRDHILGRWQGFVLGVFPEVLRHPENCQLLTHKENVAKGRLDRKKTDAQSQMDVALLFERIRSTSYDWHEQSQCIDRIERYERNERWINPYKGEDVRSPEC